MTVPDGALLLDSAVLRLPDGKWFAGFRFAVEGQGGYDRPPYDDAFRTFSSEEAAREWLAKKTGGMRAAT